VTQLIHLMVGTAFRIHLKIWRHHQTVLFIQVNLRFLLRWSILHNLQAFTEWSSISTSKHPHLVRLLILILNVHTNSCKSNVLFSTGYYDFSVYSKLFSIQRLACMASIVGNGERGELDRIRYSVSGFSDC